MNTLWFLCSFLSGSFGNFFSCDFLRCSCCCCCGRCSGCGFGRCGSFFGCCSFFCCRCNYSRCDWGGSGVYLEMKISYQYMHLVFAHFFSSEGRYRSNPKKFPSRQKKFSLGLEDFIHIFCCWLPPMWCLKAKNSNSYRSSGKGIDRTQKSFLAGKKRSARF